MLTPSPEIVHLLAPFASAFTRPTFEPAVALLYGTILACGPRTVAAALRAPGLAGERRCTTYHRVLNRAEWSAPAVSRILLALLCRYFLAPEEALVLLVDDTLERRQGRTIRWKGWFRDPVRSTANRQVTAAGRRWVCVMLLVPVPWSARPWALPLLTAPALAPGASQKLGKRHRTTIDRARALLWLVRRWQPAREVVLVGEGAYAAVTLGHRCRRQRRRVRFGSRLRLDAALYDVPAPPPPGKRGRKPRKGAPLPKLAARLADPQTAWQPLTVPWYGGGTKALEVATDTALWPRRGTAPLPIRWVLVRCPAHTFRPHAFFCTDQEATPAQVLGWYVGRRNIEVTFAEARAHLGFETQRQWSDRAIARTTPCLLGLFSLVTLMARVLHPDALPTRQAAWYPKAEPTFADALAAVRRHLWASRNRDHSTSEAEHALIPGPWREALYEAACYAA
jgi:DDE superfamily endonuclease